MTIMKIVRKTSVAAVVIITVAAFVYTAIPRRTQASNISGWRRGDERSEGEREGEGLTEALPWDSEDEMNHDQ
jgi:hypothetical protein